MTAYFIRRFLLIIPTFIGITLAVFVVMHFVPGGPVERADHALPDGRDDRGRRRRGDDRPRQQRPARGAHRGDPALLRLRQAGAHPLRARGCGTCCTSISARSYVYQDPVWDVIKSRFPVSIFLGLTGFLLSYLVCVPLGVLKAVRHGSRFDFISSVVVFLGYSVPGWALGTALLVLFGGGSFWNVFPLGGFRPDNWEYLSLWGKITGQLEHMFLPVLCYMVGSFATLTILTKNSLMENLGQDYVRTAFAKGLTERRVIFVHALRNSLIPIATGLGHVDQPDARRLVSDRARLQHRRHGLSRLHRDPAARLPGGARHPRHQQPADARRQHPVRHHLRVVDPRIRFK